MKTKIPEPNNNGHQYIGSIMIDWCRQNCLPGEWTQKTRDRISFMYQEDEDRFLKFFHKQLADFKTENDPEYCKYLESLENSFTSLSIELEELKKALSEKDATIAAYKQQLTTAEQRILFFENLVKDVVKKLNGGETPSSVSSTSCAPRQASSSVVQTAMTYTGQHESRKMLRKICEYIKNNSNVFDASALKKGLKLDSLYTGTKRKRIESIFWAACSTGRKEGVLAYNNGYYYLGKN
jgi:hypothetical protein